MKTPPAPRSTRAALSALPMLLLLPGCTGENSLLNQNNALNRVIVPPVAKFAVTSVSPFAGKKTTRTLDDLISQKKLGTFRNEPRLVSIAPNLFWFYQLEKDSEKFSFTTTAFSLDGKPWRIKHESMFFDGASVPRFLWEANGFGPLDFTKSALIHDWLFEANHRFTIARHKDTKKAIASNYRPYQLLFDSDLSETREDEGLVRVNWIMAECMRREMEDSFAARGLLGEVLGNAAANQAAAGNARKGLQDMIEHYNLSRKRPHVLGLYRFALGTSSARKVWNPRERTGLSENQSSHTSSLVTIAVLRQAYHGDPASRSRIEKLVSPWLIQELRKPPQDYLPEPDGRMVTASASTDTSTLPAYILSVIPQTQGGAGLSELLGRLEVPGARVNAPRISSSTPGILEVRFYNDEDRPAAEKILARLRTEGIVTAAAPGRISFVIDPDLTRDLAHLQRPRYFQIAFSTATFERLSARLSAASL